MKYALTILTLVIATKSGPIFGASVRFDFNAAGSPTQVGWVAADLGNGSDGSVTIATTAIGAVTVDSRDRTGGDFDADGGAEANMWNDFVFANGSLNTVPGSGLQIEVTGLEPNASFTITIWAFDDGSNPSGGFPRSATWNGENPLSFPADPDPLTLDDYRVSFVAISDAGGALTIQGIVAASDAATSHNVFINGLEISDPLADGDGDGLADIYEQIIIDADPDDAISSPADVLPEDDFDNDGSTNANEAVKFTDPTDPDSDDDGLLDGTEDGSGVWTSVTATGTDPNLPDSDSDGLGDAVENPDLPYNANDPENQPGTDPNEQDTDGDTRSDGREIFVDGTDPTDGNDFFDPVGNALVLFDFNAPGSPTQEGWVPADLGNGSDGSVSVATEAIGGVTVDTRARAGTDFDAGGGAEADMWNDFVFAASSFDSAPDTGLRITLSGLLPLTPYPITIWAFDDASNPSPAGVDRRADWSGEGGGGTLSFPAGPDPATVADYLLTFEALSDIGGDLVISGIVSATNPSASHNVFVNGLAVGQPVGGGVPFQIIDIDHEGATGTVSISWNSRPGRFYSLFVSPDLSAGSWTEIDDGIESQGDITTYAFSGPVPDPAAEPRLFFRVAGQ